VGSSRNKVVAPQEVPVNVFVAPLRPTRYRAVVLTSLAPRFSFSATR
jgi:hypothetical protein